MDLYTIFCPMLQNFFIYANPWSGGLKPGTITTTRTTTKTTIRNLELLAASNLAFAALERYTKGSALLWCHCIRAFTSTLFAAWSKIFWVKPLTVQQSIIQIQNQQISVLFKVSEFCLCVFKIQGSLDDSTNDGRSFPRNEVSCVHDEVNQMKDFEKKT